MQRFVSKGIGTNWQMEQRWDDIAQKIRGSQKNIVCALDIEHTVTPQTTPRDKAYPTGSVLHKDLCIQGRKKTYFIDSKIQLIANMYHNTAYC